ncbi:hypothetical protein WDV06_36860, partial [Streptomyces racemochromogenes]
PDDEHPRRLNMDTVKPHLKAVSFIHNGPCGNLAPRWFYGWRCEAVVDGQRFVACATSAHLAFVKVDAKIFEWNLKKDLAEARRSIHESTLRAGIDPRLAQAVAVLAQPTPPPLTWFQRLLRAIGRK